MRAIFKATVCTLLLCLFLVPAAPAQRLPEAEPEEVGMSRAQLGLLDRVMAEALQKQQIVNTFDQNGALSVPIKISGRAVGAIRVRKSSDRVTWSEDEIELIEVLTDRLSQALESARVYQTSQRQALQEQLTGEISSQLRQTLDIDTVLKTAARELGDAFNAKEVVIRMAPNEPTN